MRVAKTNIVNDVECRRFIDNGRVAIATVTHIVDFGPPGPKYLDSIVRDFGLLDQIF